MSIMLGFKCVYVILCVEIRKLNTISKVFLTNILSKCVPLR